MNAIEFTIKMRDMMSGGLGKLNSTANSAFTRMNAYTQSHLVRNQALANSYNELQKRIAEVERTAKSSVIPAQIAGARRELQALQQQARNHIGNTSFSVADKKGGGIGSVIGGTAIGAIAGNLVMSGVSAVSSTVLNGISQSVSSAMDRQMVQTSFNTLTGSERSGKALTSDLVSLQKDTVLGSEVFKNAQTMLGFGFGDKDVVANMRMLGDIAMGDTQKLESLTLAFSQVRAGGKLTGQDLLQFINAGFNPLQEISQKTGKSMAVLKQEMADGKVSFSDVQQAIQLATGAGGRYNGMLDKLAQTPAGKLQQFQGALDEFKISAGTAFLPLLSLALEWANKLLPIAESIIPYITTGVQTVVSWINNASIGTSGWMDYLVMAKEIIPYYLEYMNKLYNYLGNVISGWAKWISKSELMKDIFSWMVSWVKQLYMQFSALIDLMQWWFDNITMPILNGIESAYKLIKGTHEVKITAETPQQKKDKEIREKNGEAQKKIVQSWSKIVEQTSKPDINSRIATARSNHDYARTNSESISSGGGKTVHITLGKFFDNIIFNTQDNSLAPAQLESIISEYLARVLYQTSKTV